MRNKEKQKIYRKKWDLLNPDKRKQSRELWKKKTRQNLLNLKIEKGGKCEMCGYCKEVRILHFHHLKDKNFSLGEYAKLEKMKKEAEKCILLCPNCHALIHLTSYSGDEFN